ncbi:MAG TPA: GNAT family N-acetyltransferase [Thermodesulfovibrionales bacterium]|nr:GNAT family N-acetyltransferase [Thermodesulfovibrionales bacterium]
MQEVQKFPADNGEEVTLRGAMPEDAGAILKTLKSTSPERSYVLMEQYGKNAESEKDYIRGMDREENLLLVAEMNGTVVGSLGALQADEGQNPQTGHILRVGLHLAEAFRGIGIGSHMLEYAAEWAREHGFKKLEASIFTTNKRSLHLFSRAGFQEEGTRRKRFWVGNDYIDEVLMGKILE